MLKRLTPFTLAALAFVGPALAQETAVTQTPAAAVEGTISTPTPPVTEGAVAGPVVPPPGLGVAAQSGSDWQFWMDFNYLLGFVRGDTLPPLVTTSPVGTPRTTAGVLGQPTTSTLIGLQNENISGRSGFQFSAGWWFHPDHSLGLETDIFFLSDASHSQTIASQGVPILARPFFNVATGAEASILIAYPGVSTGSVQVEERAHTFWGYDLDLRENMLCCPGYRFDSLLGYRYMRYDETLNVTSNAQPVGVAVAGTNIETVDTFTTHNVFNGADLGMQAEFNHANLYLDLLTKVAVGVTQHTVNIDGFTTTTVPGTAPATVQGGLLALSSNIGHHPAYDYSAIPELGVKLGWQVTPNMRVQAGYSIMWWFDVDRPGQQVNLNVNPGLIPPPTGTGGAPAEPTTTGQKTNLWMQAFNVGVQFRF